MENTDAVYDIYAGKDLSQLSRVTLVIPTYNRNFYLSRCLWYHAHFPFAEIIVADSSPEDKRIINRNTVEEIRKLYHANITYLEYDFPAEEYGGEIYRKWRSAVQHVNTEYSLSCTDKEFLIPTTVVSSVDFLDKNPDYSIADGLYFMIESPHLIYSCQGTESLTQDSVNERIQYLLNSNSVVGTQFALQRAEMHKHGYENIDKYNLYDLRFGETEIELNPIMLGKNYRDNSKIMSIRDTIYYYHKSPFRKTSNYNKSESSFSRYPILTEYTEERFYEYLNQLTNCLANYDEKQRGIISQIISKTLTQRYMGKVHSPLLSKSKLLFRIWDDYLPYHLKYFLSKKFGAAMVQPPITRKQKTPEIRLIHRIVMSTMRYHKMDDVIPFSDNFLERN